MRRHLFLAALLTLGFTAGAFAQGFGQSGGGGGGGGFGGGGGGGLGGGGGGGLGISGGGGGGLGISGGGGGGNLGGGNLGGGGGNLGGTGMTGGRTGTTGGRGAGGGTGGFQIDQSNAFARTFANPLYVGRPASTNYSLGEAGVRLQGQGFGQPSFGTTITRVTTTGIAGTGRVGTAGIGGRGLGGGFGGAGQMPEASYAAIIRFAPPPVVVTTIRTDLQGLFDRSSALSRPGGVRVEADGEVIVLRGRVANEDEKRLAEGMVRLEPGVREVRNELEIGP